MGKEKKIKSNNPFSKSRQPKTNSTNLTDYKPKVASNRIESPKWVFSFQYFKQIKFFGLSNDKVNNKWFVSLLEKLRELGLVEIEQFKTSSNLKQTWRYHEIDWYHTNVPIKRSSLDWIPAVYLNNEDEYPMMQFQISKALGRIVGFWNETSTIFNIVLLDSLHNIQPSGGKYGYKVNDSKILGCQYTSLIDNIKTAKRYKSDQCDKCKAFEHLEKIPWQGERKNFFAVFLDDDMVSKLGDNKIQDILELGLLAEEE